MPTPRKVAQVAQLQEVLERAEIAISAAYQGEPMARQVELRSQLRAAGVEMYVVKNTLLRLAAQNIGRPEYADLAEEATAIVVGYDEPVGAAKALTGFIRSNDGTKVTIRRAVVGGEMVDEAYVRDLATLPSREELAAKLAGNVIAKITELAGLLEATQREFAGLIEARAKQLEDQAA